MKEIETTFLPFEERGIGGLYELVEELTDEFKMKIKDDDWFHHNYFEEIEEFLNNILN